MSNPDNVKEIRRIGQKHITLCMARDPDSARCYFGGSDFLLREIDFAAEKPEETIEFPAGHQSYVTGVALAGDVLVSGSYDRQLIWWDRHTREVIRKVSAHDKLIRGVTASPDGKTVASVADDMVCRLWEVETGKPLHELKGHEQETPNHYPSMLYASAFSPDGQWLATADKVGHVVVWNVKTGNEETAFESPENYTWDPKARRHSIGGIRSLAFSPDGKQLAVGGMGKVGNIDHLGGKSLVQIYDWRTGERSHQFEHEKRKGLVESLAWHHEAKWLLAAGGDNGGFLLFLDLATGKFMREEDAKVHLHAALLNETSDTIYAVGHNSLVHWELKG